MTLLLLFFFSSAYTLLKLLLSTLFIYNKNVIIMAQILKLDFSSPQKLSSTIFAHLHKSGDSGIIKNNFLIILFITCLIT